MQNQERAQEMPEGIVVGRKYVVDFQSDINLLTLNYKFKPSSLDLNKDGTARVTESNGSKELSVSLPNSDTTNEIFLGAIQKSTQDFLLRFDGGVFKLCKVSEVANMRHMRNEKLFSQALCISAANKRTAKPLKKSRSMKKDLVCSTDSGAKSTSGRSLQSSKKAVALAAVRSLLEKVGPMTASKTAKNTKDKKAVNQADEQSTGENVESLSSPLS